MTFVCFIHLRNVWVLLPLSKSVFVDQYFPSLLFCFSVLWQNYNKSRMWRSVFSLGFFCFFFNAQIDNFANPPIVTLSSHHYLMHGYCNLSQSRFNLASCFFAEMNVLSHNINHKHECIFKMYTLGSLPVCAFKCTHVQMENKRRQPNGNTQTTYTRVYCAALQKRCWKEYWSQSRPASHPNNGSVATDPLNAKWLAMRYYIRHE